MDGTTEHNAGTLEIPGRFCGPPGVGNGGYVCGRLAAHARRDVEVTLRRGVPLERPLAVVAPADDRMELRDGDALLAEALAVDLDVVPPAPVSFDDAEAAAKRHP